MLLVTYNSNPRNKPELPTIRGWSLYTKEDWWALCSNVDSYFYIMPEGDAELINETVGYHSYEEWLSDYQVCEISKHAEETLLEYNDNIELLCFLLGHDFYVPNITTQPDDEPIYPEMDAYA